MKPEDFRAAWRAAADSGLAGLCVPGRFGGGGLGAVDTAEAVEAAGRDAQDLGLVFGMMAHLLACAMPVAEFGSDELRAGVLPRLCSGEWIAGNAITEREAGSDTGKLSTTAVRTDDHYLLTGEKSFVSNATVADVFVVYAVTDPALGYLGISALLVERDSPGVTVGEPLPKLGLTGCPAAVVRFEDCPVPAANLIGREGSGAAVFRASMRWERTCLFAAYLGAMDGLLDRTVEHARSRRQFGRPIGANQAVSHRLADLKVRVESARALLYRACAAMDRGEVGDLDVAMAKLAVSEAAVEVGLAAVQIFGAAGYAGAGSVDALLRDAIGSTIFSGTSEIQRELIAKEMGL
ncbi:acyl-CoA dehydrogenase family protein [Allokutzneria albata]|uniref:Acyl-CoA dehydrogenase n=1 Tax=Allokutzneria albata TaxID=211114 RepID=A0A1G9U9H5_ALLAB|nr:acyl-CoA dehydrogenase family protein [Allokutzneria albata]SDM56600.1 Acyl-CoA dehydrogenase [Allokutzneria albata]